MTIIFLSRLFHPHIGGVEKHLLEISKRLVKKHKVIIITEKFNPQAPLYENLSGIDIYRINPGPDNWFKKFYLWKTLWSYHKLFNQADIIHCHDVFFWYLPFRFLFPKKKVFTTFHGYETKVPPRRGAILIRKLSELLSYGNICVGAFIEKWYGTKSNYITYGGTNRIKNLKLRIKNSGKLKIIFIGRLENDLGLKTYMHILEKLKRQKILFSFSAFGDGPMRSEVKRFGKVYGFVKDTDKALAGANIVFVSSYLSMLDALVQKKLVIAVFENPLKEDYLKMSPFADYVILESDPERIAERINYFQNDLKEKETFVTRGYEWARKQTWENVCSVYEKLWHTK